MKIFFFFLFWTQCPYRGKKRIHDLKSKLRQDGLKCIRSMMTYVGHIHMSDEKKKGLMKCWKNVCGISEEKKCEDPIGCFFTIFAHYSAKAWVLCHTANTQNFPQSLKCSLFKIFLGIKSILVFSHHKTEMILWQLNADATSFIGMSLPWSESTPGLRWACIHH